MGNEIYLNLRKRFIFSCLILLAIFASIFVHHRINLDNLEKASYSLSMICFISSVILTICFPIIIRLITFNEVKTNGKIKIDKYIKFKNIVLISVFIGSLFALFGYYKLMYEGLLTISILCSLYGIYSVIPSMKTIDIELVEFNVFDNKNDK